MSRSTIAGGTLPNDPEHLAHWIRNTQQIKPGTTVPPIALNDADMAALLAYLRTLQ